jgi:hypothetical protein
MIRGQGVCFGCTVIDNISAMFLWHRFAFGKSTLNHGVNIEEYGVSGAKQE